MLQQSPAPKISDHVVLPATYGTLMGLARDALDHAVFTSSSQPSDLQTALNNLHGYNRFLRTAGAHLHLLARATGFPSTNALQLARRLAKVRTPDDVAPNAWVSVATNLGAAHDLVATHLDTSYAARTVEAEDLLTGVNGVVASRHLTELVLDAAEPGRELIHHAAVAQRHLENGPLSRSSIRRLRATNEAITLLGSAAMWDLRAAQGSGPALGSLRVAFDRDMAASSPRFTTAMDALRALRELVAGQACSQLTASPASLRDLALLGQSVFDPGCATSKEPAEGLPRLREAHAQDRLEAAQEAWAHAATGLTRTIQGVTKAPAQYAASVTHLLNPEVMTASTRLAIAAALPRLGRDAKRVVTRMVEDRDLLSPQQVPCQVRTEWRPITPQEGAALAVGFELAADASVHAVNAFHELISPARRPHDSGRDPTIPWRRVLDRELSR